MFAFTFIETKDGVAQRLANMAPAPKRAAALALLLMDVAEGTFDVYEALETLDAPENSGPATVTVMLPGLRTLSMT
jgi:hypothetical protein